MNKKSYSAPTILFEDFTLTANIASGCGYIDSSQNTEGLFMEGCTNRFEPVEGEGSGCYHVGPDGSNAFSS